MLLQQFFRYEDIGDEQIRRIVRHKYSSVGVSVLDPLLQQFWNNCVEYIPKRVAPNTLTLIGLIGNILSVIPLIYYSSNFKSEIPPLLVFLFALAVFIYQTLDAIDGKHARRTNTCSQLGELFDHGCDAIAMYLLSVGHFAVIGLGHSPAAMFAQFFLLSAIFYTSHWEAYVTGSLFFDGISVTESILFSIYCSTVSVLLGVNFWQTPDRIFGIEMNLIIVFVTVIGSMILFYRFAQTILEGGAGKSGTTVANTSVLFPVFPFLLVLLSASIVAANSPTNVYQNYPHLFLLGFGAILAKISQNLVLAHMTTSGLQLIDKTMLGPACMLGNMCLDYPLSEHLLLWFNFIWATVVMIGFCVRVSIQVANTLNLYIFRVDKPPPLNSATQAKRPLSNQGLRSRAPKGVQ